VPSLARKVKGEKNLAAMDTFYPISLSWGDQYMVCGSIYRLNGALFTEFHYSGGEKCQVRVAYQSILTVLDLFSVRLRRVKLSNLTKQRCF